MNIAIFGGTFNPPHNTHIQLAQAAKQQLHLDRLFVVPCGIPPHKNTHCPSEVRLRLSQLAFGSFAEVSDWEIARQGKSYTVETLRHFKQLFPNDNLFLVIGGDSFKNFPKWHKPQEIASLCTLAVAPRGRKVSAATLKRVQQATGAKVVLLNTLPNSVNSTEIRLRYQFGKDNSRLVPPQTHQYVLQHNLYAQYQPMVRKLQSYISPQRFEHTFWVVVRGLQLATEEQQHKAFVACLLHDCAKNIAQQNYAVYGFERPSDMPEAVAHAFLGALVAEKDFGVTDREILDAICYHTTGRPNMTDLEKLVYLADKTEKTRPYPVAHIIKGSLQTQFKKCLWEAVHVACSRQQNLYPLSLETLHFYFPKTKI